MAADVLIRREGWLGRITLNRPAALNALTLAMVRGIRTALEDWAGDDSVAVVVIDAIGERAFCAGGDVAALHAAAVARQYDLPARFWAEEYAMIDRIATYPKPVVALVQGFCLGGGVGLACHARHRVVGQSARIAMPECAIGLVPDVGGTLLMARAPEGVGVWMALTGARLEPGPALAAGLADLHVPEAQWGVLRAALAAGEAVEGVLTRLRADAPVAKLSLPDDALRAAFRLPTVPQIRAALAAMAGDAARAALKALDGASPLALATALLMQQRLGPAAGLRAAMALEYRAVQRALKQGDFVEGVRARIIDRDNAPRWRHAGPDSVSRVEAAAQLAALEGGELELEEGMTP